MALAKWQDIVEQLKERAIEFAPGLADAEIASVEKGFGFHFPPDLRAFLQTALPQGKAFPDWRSGDEKTLRHRLDLPRRGVLFDVERNFFWLPEWGLRPERLADALQAAEKLIAAAPKLIPVFEHRMMPDEPFLEGNPVFSVHQTDIIYYGFNLEDYLRHEFDLPGRALWPDSGPEKTRPIRFWDIGRFQEVRWTSGPVEFDNRRSILP
jgi:hypothetical protein